MEAKHYPSMTQPERRAMRERYVRHQNGKCHFCAEPLSGPPGERAGLRVRWASFPLGFQNHLIHLHHNHETGMTIGAVHMKCNAVLWQYHGE